MTDSVGKVVQAVHPIAAGNGTGADGTRLPASGNRPSPAVAAAVTEQVAADLESTVRQLNAQMIESRRALRFQVDDSSGRTIITVLNPETGEIVRQIPSVELLALARWLAGESEGLVLQERA